MIVEQVARNKTKTNAYHIGARLFELSELKMLADAVSSSRFITTEKSETLIHKLAELTNVENRESLTTRIHTASRMKTSNPNVFVTIDTIYRAIQHQRKISFRYWDYTPTKEKILRHDGAEYIVSPYALIWDDDRYYVPSYSDSRQKIVHFRIDRMCDVTTANETACETSRDKSRTYPRLPARFTPLGYGCLLDFTVFGPLIRQRRLVIGFLFVGPRFRYGFFSPAPRGTKLASRYRVRRQLRPLGLPPKLRDMPVIPKKRLNFVSRWQMRIFYPTRNIFFDILTLTGFAAIKIALLVVYHHVPTRYQQE